MPNTTNDKTKAMWSDAHDKLLMKELLKVDEAGKSTNGYKKSVWQNVTEKFNNKFKEQNTTVQIKARHATLKRKHEAYRNLQSMSGFGWDTELKTFTPPADVWKDYLKVKSQNIAQQFRQGPFVLNKLSAQLFDGKYAKGHGAYTPQSGSSSTATTATPTTSTPTSAGAPPPARAVPRRQRGGRLRDGAPAFARGAPTPDASVAEAMNTMVDRKSSIIAAIDTAMDLVHADGLDSLYRKAARKSFGNPMKAAMFAKLLDSVEHKEYLQEEIEELDL
ncbi:Myb/SANT-like DNA-binding domain-containing protein [Phlyctochytrium arcticum]|nr:Myb/SANT-like DNA-binding domain-containing protein [Phlyctochytrium arcticum]